MGGDPNKLFGGQGQPQTGGSSQPPRIAPFNVPQDIFNAILDAASGDEDFAAVLAAQIYQETRFRTADLSADDVPQYAQQLLDALKEQSGVSGDPTKGYQTVSKLDQLLNAAMISGRRRGVVSAVASDAYRAALERQSSAGITPGAERAPRRERMSPEERAASAILGDQLRQAIRDRAPATADDIHQLYQDYLGREPENESAVSGRVGQPYGTLVEQFVGSTEHALWRQYGGRIKDVRSWANSIYRQYLGHEPSNDEVRAIIDNRWTPDKLETWLRDRPFGGSTLGAASDLRTLAIKEAHKFLGRDPDEGEINWLLTNGRTTGDDVSAFYEQAKTRKDSGDPAFAWVGDPESWRQTRDVLQSLWTNAGLKGKVDPRFVNSAQTGKWSIDDMRDQVNALPAPGFTGITVGEAGRVRNIAQGWKDNYLPGQPLTHEEMAQFVGMNSDEIRTYYRSLPVALHREAKGRQQQVAAAKDTSPAGATTARPPAAPAAAQPPDRSQQSGFVPESARKAGVGPAAGYKIDPRSGDMVVG